MARNYQQPGAIIDYANGEAADYSAGDVVVMGDTVGIALVDIPKNSTGSVAIEGTFTVPKASGTAWGQGDRLDWDASASAFEKGATPASGDVIGCAIAFAAAGADDEVGVAKIVNPGLPTD